MNAAHYISALLYYMYRKMKVERGSLVSIKTREICKTDKRCSWYLREIMLDVERRGLAKRHKQGVYLIERNLLERVISTVKEEL